MKNVYIITQERCPSCPAAKAVVDEAISIVGNGVTRKDIDLLQMNDDFEFRLLENQIFISSTPTILFEHDDGRLVQFSSGSVPDVDEIVGRLIA